MNEKEVLSNLANECNSYSEILRKQGKAVSGDAVNHLKEKLILYNIDFVPTHKNIDNFKKKSIEEYLKDNTPCSSNSLKKRLISGMVLSWQTMKLRMVSATISLNGLEAVGNILANLSETEMMVKFIH